MLWNLALHIFTMMSLFRSEGIVFAILPLNKQNGSLAFKRYSHLIENKLESLGWIKSDKNSTEYHGFLRYGIGDGRESITSNRGRISIFGSTTTTYNKETVYTRFLNFNAIDKKKVLQASLLEFLKQR